MLHSIALIGVKRRLRHHWQGPYLAKMQVRVDIGRGDEIALGIDFSASFAIGQLADLGKTAVRDRDISEFGLTVSKADVANENVNFIRHAAKPISMRPG